MDFIAAQMIAPRNRACSDRERLAATAHAKKAAKHKGRNHWRNWERRQIAAEKRRAALAKEAVKQTAISRYLAEARAYWRGERDSLPGKPA